MADISHFFSQIVGFPSVLPVLRHILAKQAGTVTVSLSPPYSELQHISHNAPEVCPGFSASFLDPCQGKGGAVIGVGRAETHLSQSPAGGCLKSSHPRGESVGLQPWGKERGKSQTTSLDVETLGTEKVTWCSNSTLGLLFQNCQWLKANMSYRWQEPMQFSRCQMRQTHLRDGPLDMPAGFSRLR